MSYINKSDTRLVDAFSKGAARWDKSFGNPQSGSPLETYNQLKPEDFNRMTQDFGANNVINYIQTMEHQRLKGG